MHPGRVRQEHAARRLTGEARDTASASAIAAAEEKAAAVTALVDEYEGAFVAVGRTLAETIHLPAKIFTKAIWLHNMMEVTEGPVTQPMKEAFDRIKADSDAADTRYESQISGALDAFEASAGT